MQRTVESFSSGKSYRVSGSDGGGTIQQKTAAQLLQLQKLVESLVVRELDRGSGTAGGAPAPDDAANQQRHTQGRRGADGNGSGRRGSSANGSDGPSLDYNSRGSSSRGAPAAVLSPVKPNAHAAGPSSGGAQAPSNGHRSGALAPGPVRGWAGSAPGDGALADSVPVQVATLQGQLALLSEQLNSAYRAAEGVASPRAGGVTAASALRGQGLLGSSNGGSAGLEGPGRAGYASLQPVYADAPAQPAAAAAAYKPHFLTSAMTAGPVASVSEFFSEAGGGGGTSGGGPSGAGRTRQSGAEERASREAAAREDERLRVWIQELRAERRRLEDRLLGGDAAGGSEAQLLRDELEKQVLSLSRQRDQLAAELRELGITGAANAQLGGQVDALATALAAEEERVARYKEIRPALEARVAEVSSSLETLRQQHSAALEAMARERDAAALKARRSSKRASELEVALAAANSEVQRQQDEVRAVGAALAEARAGSEVLHSASQQLQASMEAQARETATRLATVQAQLESSQSDGVILRRQLDTAQKEAAALRAQRAELHAQLDSLAAERERLAGGLTDEQQALAAARQEAESLQLQLKASEEARAEAARLAFAQQEAARRQHAAELTAMQRQYESQLAAAEKQYLLLQRQYDAGLGASEVAEQAAAALRRERDALWAEAENLKAELDEARKEKADVSAKLAALRSEVRATMDEVARDRDARLATAASQGEAAILEARAESDRRVSAVKQEYEARIKGLNDAIERLRSDASDSQRHVDKYRATVSHLKNQVRELLLRRDAAERELASERSFNEELNRILAAIRAEQQGGA